VRKLPDVSTMSEAFHDWLDECPCMYSKKFGENIYEFWETGDND